MKLLALVLLLSAFFSLTLTEVEESLSSFKEHCHDFFIPNPEKQNDIIVPTIFSGDQYKKICQRLNNRYRFATVYDTVRRIPVYSAYTFSQEGETTRSEEWKIEPQLENEMIVSPREAGNIINQAVDIDYTGSVYTRGHVFPRSFAANQDQADSTFTLTNIAPQRGASNGEWADKVETEMLKEIKRDCSLDQNHKAYIVTGVVPGEKWISVKREGRVIEEGINIPSHFWSAFCCTSKNNNDKFIMRAYIAELENFKLRRPMIDNLNDRLTKLYNKHLYNKTLFRVFPGFPPEKVEADWSGK